MILNYLIIQKNNFFLKKKNTIVLLHGLFGNKKSLYTMGKFLFKNLKYNIILLDIRNHGSSPSHKKMNYLSLSKDVLETLNFLNIKKNIIFIGHSMGGKIAMNISQFISFDNIKIIIILDIAPVKYKFYNKNIFFALEQVYKKKIEKRKDVFYLIKSLIKNQYIINMLLKTFIDGKWEFNFPILKNEYKKILDWKLIPKWKGKIFFLKGEQSTYISKIYYKDIFFQFPNAKIYNIPNTGHLLHIENTKLVFNLIQKLCYK
ncbi:alpha/beta fold hydrolase [Enterobacteriaceae endosymbiont of Donacia bicoloricornis]|uniref:alpha/beta fold hydrolase n=1 Tax=Enterobacteriaceae endosymbiont of Donacia bicoloricornis TaxID=2675772 RepID=UPI00144982BF|nr:alpha/beta fold hydrolase [Enterobacteriaceae endosymbiont of Donacia bicoloricornis]QJC37819.1 alpha/beta fold hydrolase [Enterobacteriaceae endosymbiont of Donacia bicoloricornis]